MFLTEFDVYETYDDDKHKFKLAKLEIFQPSLKEFYDIFNKALTKLYEVTSDLLDLYDQVKNLYDYKLPRTYNCINRDLAKQYENCILKEKKLVETITNIQTSTCYSDLKNWAEIKKQTCINAIKQDGPYNKAKSDYLKLESASRQLENYFYSEKQDQQHLFTMRSNIFRRVQQYNANINATLDHYVNEMLKMKILNYGTNAIKVYSDVFTGKCKIGVWREVDDWSYQLRSEKKDFQKQINSIDFYGRECGSLNEQLQTSLEDIEELNVRPTKQLVENFVSGQIFVVQNGCEYSNYSKKKEKKIF